MKRKCEGCGKMLKGKKTMEGLVEFMCGTWHCPYQAKMRRFLAGDL